MRVYLLGIDVGQYNQALALQHEADVVFRWDRADVQSFLKHEPPAETPTIAEATADGATTIEGIARELLGTIPQDKLETVASAVRGGNIPPEWDALLLRAGAKGLRENPLQDETRRNLRKAFKAAVKTKAPG